jgi:hypothetical protein
LEGVTFSFNAGASTNDDVKEAGLLLDPTVKVFTAATQLWHEREEGFDYFDFEHAMPPGFFCSKTVQLFPRTTWHFLRNSPTEGKMLGECCGTMFYFKWSLLEKPPKPVLDLKWRSSFYVEGEFVTPLKNENTVMFKLPALTSIYLLQYAHLVLVDCVAHFVSPLTIFIYFSLKIFDEKVHASSRCNRSFRPCAFC